ncbi:MAG: PIN domain-containing protein [Nanoarchaeota archaeon]|nr:PIN domain-containing protein [Nanoarchaeota archaeon]
MADNFLDTNVIFNYSNYTNYSNKIIEKCYFFIKNKTGDFILCYAVLGELEEVRKKRARIHKAVIEKIKDSSYSFENNSLLSVRDVPKAKQLFEKFKSASVNNVEKSFSDERNLSEIKIEKFLQTNIDEKVIPLSQINPDLVNKIYDIIPNHADSMILASAIQLQSQEGRKLFLFVTADGKDLDPNGYEFLKGQFEINYPKESWKFPELLNFLFTK